MCLSAAKQLLKIFNVVFLITNMVLAILFAVYVFSDAPNEMLNQIILFSFIGLALVFMFGTCLTCSAKKNNCFHRIYMVLLAIFIIAQFIVMFAVLFGNHVTDGVFEAMSTKLCDSAAKVGDSLASAVHTGQNLPWFCCCPESCDAPQNGTRRLQTSSSSWAPTMTPTMKPTASNVSKAPTMMPTKYVYTGAKVCDPSLTGAHKYMQMKNEWKSLDPPLPCKNKKDCTKQNFSSKVMAGVVTGILVLEMMMVIISYKLSTRKNQASDSADGWADVSEDMEVELSAKDAMKAYGKGF